MFGKTKAVNLCGEDINVARFAADCEGSFYVIKKADQPAAIFGRKNEILNLPEPDGKSIFLIGKEFLNHPDLIGRKDVKMPLFYINNSGVKVLRKFTF